MKTQLLACLAMVSVAQAFVRQYYIAAEEVVWDYAPTGYNNYDNTTLDEGNAAIFLSNTKALIGPRYKKAQYIEYTDANFTTVKPTPEWLGNVGPMIRAEVDDELEITFYNKATRPYTMHPHGVKYTSENEGVYNKFSRNFTGAAVAPNATYTYKWSVPERSGPGYNDGQAVLWMYHSHYEEIADVYSGLAGPMAIYKKGTLNADGMPTDVEKEFFILYQATDENQSHYLADNCKAYGCDEEDADFEESNLMHSMNGRMYANLEGLEMTVGDKIRWFVAAFGTEVDIHSSHWHGNVIDLNQHHTDVIDLMPASFRTGYMQPDAAGVWLLHCHVNDHIAAGMLNFYVVNEKAV